MRKRKEGRPVRVLQVCLCGSRNIDGVQHFLYGYYSHMNKELVTFDYLFLNRRPENAGNFAGLLDNTNIYELDVLSIQNTVRRYLLMIRKTREVIKKRRYDVIHINTGQIYIAMLMVYIAKRERIPVRIAHSHGVYTPGKLTSKIGTKLFKGFVQRSIVKDSTHQFACSEKAGNSMFGNEKGHKKYRILKNAIEVEQFRYSPETRARIRKNMGVANEKVIITVGNLVAVKNHSFLIDAFRIALKEENGIRLWIVGGGKLKETLQTQIDLWHLSGQAILLGARNDVDELLQAADLYVCTSFSEGLSLSVVEAQTSGLRVLASDGISREHRITDLVDFFPLNAGENKWALEIVRLLKQEYVREDKYQEMVDAGYEIKAAANRLEKFYVSSVRGVNRCN